MNMKTDKRVKLLQTTSNVKFKIRKTFLKSLLSLKGPAMSVSRDQDLASQFNLGTTVYSTYLTTQ